ncbi:MAG: hypothetical protein ACRDDY_00680 [Clostridium sp.]|uniref:hypothetical protein n=1 Tax=Clostridium sp. TaxID=1506 RepID=UPI003EE7119E
MDEVMLVMLTIGVGLMVTFALWQHRLRIVAETRLAETRKHLIASIGQTTTLLEQARGENPTAKKFTIESDIECYLLSNDDNPSTIVYKPISNFDVLCRYHKVNEWKR